MRLGSIGICAVALFALAGCDDSETVDEGGISFDASIDGGGSGSVVTVRVMNVGSHASRGLSDLEPIVGAAVTLRQHVDDLTVEELSDADGYVRFGGVDWTAPVDVHVQS